MSHQCLQWEKLLCSDRYRGRSTTKENKTVEGRTQFDIDVSKITFSGYFRRLSRKTQVHPLVVNDHVHTRLTHSLEVARVAKVLGNMLHDKLLTDERVNEPYIKELTDRELGTILEAACLAHDIGNPPFGHAGERAMSHWLSEGISNLVGQQISSSKINDLVNFEGNAQGFRILTQIDNHLFNGGLQLTYATLGTFLKYPCTYEEASNNKKFGAFIAEEGILKDVATRLGLKKLDRDGKKWCRHPLAYLVEAADDICYAIIDIEDAIELNLYNYDDYEELCFRHLDDDKIKQLKVEFDELKKTGDAPRIKLARLRGDVFDLLVTHAIDTFLDNYVQIMNGNFEKELFEKDGEKHAERLVSSAKDVFKTEILDNTKKLEIELGCYSVLETLLENVVTAAYKRNRKIQEKESLTLQGKYELSLKVMGNHAPVPTNFPKNLDRWDSYHCIRRALDYVGGMTDNYAVHISQQMKGISPNGIQKQ